MSDPADTLADAPLDHETRVERIADGFRPFEVAHVTHQSLDGTRRLGPMRREFIRCSAAAIVIPYDPASDRIVVIRQFRIGNALATPNAAAIELPAGLLDAGEAIEATAARELFEETGLRASAVGFCYSVLTSPGFSDELAHIVLAIVDASSLSGAAGLADEDEDIRPIAASADALIRAVDEGLILNHFVVGAVHWFARHGRARAALLQAGATARAGARA